MYGKGGKKGGGHHNTNNVQNQQQNQEKNRQILDQLLPLVASKIDENGGVMRVNDIVNLSDIKNLINQIPKGCTKSLQSILTEWTDFFVNMPNEGLVGTAMGYDTGMIREDGSLDPAFASTFSAANITNKDSVIQKGGVHHQATTGPHDKIDLTEATDELWRACLNLEDDSPMYMAFSKVQTARANVRGTVAVGNVRNWAPSNNAANLQQVPGSKVPKGNINFNDQERERRKELILQKVIEKLQAAQGYSLNLNILAGDQFIRETKKGVIAKFMNWVQEFPQIFALAPVEGSPQFSVTLLEPSAPSAKRSRVDMAL